MLKRLLALVSLATTFTLAHADIIPVAVNADKLGWFDKNVPTLTYTQKAPTPRGTLLIIMGGEGRIALERGEQAAWRPTINMLRPLVAQGYNLVVFDSPYDLTSTTDMAQPRYGSDHQRRIDEVVEYYKNLYGFPVWLFGHSVGATSVAEYANRVKSDPGKLAGIIVSGENQSTSIDVRMQVPVLIIHHANDPCPKCSPYSARRQYERVKSNTTSYAELAWVTGGDGSGENCRDGYHMYKGSLDQAEAIIERFMR
jgi:pimeloyl-ACP methyl ester carboxylesterase